MARRIFTDVNMNQNQLLQARLENLPASPTSPQEGQLYYNTVSKKYYGWNNTDWIDLSQVIANAVSLRGEIANAASKPAFPASPSVGDMWRITTQDGQVGTEVVEVGDTLVYSASGWFAIERNEHVASQTSAGLVRLCTVAEAIAGTDGVAVSGATLVAMLQNALYTRKVRAVLATLAANTPTTIPHGLGVANAEDVHCQCYQGGEQIELGVKVISGNALSVTSNQALGNVIVIIQG